MRKKTLRMISSILTLVFLASLFQAPMPVEAANTATIPVTVGGQTINVTPGQWVTVNTPGGSTSYNVRFVDGKPVALEMSQYTKLVFGDAASAAGTANAGSNTTGSTGNNAASGAAGSNTGNAGTVDLGGSNSGSAAQTSTGAAQTSTPAQQTSTGAAQTSGSAAQTSTTTTTTTTGSKPMTWNEFQKANAGKGMSGSEMGQAWQDYKQTNGITSGSSSSAAQTTSTGAAQTSTGAAQTSTPTPTTSVADGSAAAAQTTTTTTTSTPAAQTSTGAAQASTPTTSVADGSAAAAQSSKTSTWNPAKHPRDPQTGKFISHEEAVARGLMDPADANISSNNSSSSQTAQASTDSSAATQNAGAETTTASTETTATSGQAAQAGTDVAAASGEAKPTIGDKFKAGYETGKNLTNAGFQNVKDSLKSGFSAKNLLVTAGITVGVDLATQVMRGENPSLKSALKTVCCAEFVGGVAGSVIGSAAGSFFVPFLSCIPVVGGALSALAPAFGSIVGSSVGAYTAGDLKNGRFSIKEAFKRIDWVGVTGQAIGSTVGAALGSCLGPVGTVLGGMVGGYFGNWAAQKIAGLFGKGNANLPVVATPVGSSGNNITTAGTVTLGGADVTSVSVSNDIPVVVADDNDEQKSEGMSGSDVEQAITEAYEEYTDLYTEYSQLIQAGKQQEAIEVAEKMNAAKARYDELRKKG